MARVERGRCLAILPEDLQLLSCIVLGFEDKGFEMEGWGLVFEVRDLGFGVWGLGLRVEGFRVARGVGFRVRGSGFRAKGEG